MEGRPFLAIGAATLIGLIAGVAQAADLAHGRQAYADNCASCHGGRLDDGEFGPALKGAAFQAEWAAQPPGSLLAFMQAKMPPAGPGSLGVDAYADIQAYVLAQGGDGVWRGRLGRRRSTTSDR